MAEPTKTPPHSDIEGVNRDARAGTPDKSHTNPGGAINHAKNESTARPKESEPQR